MYCYTGNFLYKTTMKVTAIEFKPIGEHDTPFVVFDLNKRVVEVRYIPGEKYSDIVFNEFSRLSDNEITEGTYLCIDSDIIINGIRYYFNDLINYLEVFIYNPTEVGNYFLNNDDTGLFIIGSNYLDTWTINDYVEFINNSGMILAEIVSEEQFKIVNIFSVDRTYSKVVFLNNQDVFSYSQIGISEKDILSQFIERLHDAFPKYIFSPGLSDLMSQDQKQNLIFYTSKLTEPGTEYSTRVMDDPEYGHMSQVSMNVEFEYLSDDLETYLKFREMMFLCNIFHQFTSFVLVDSRGDKWTYSVDWTHEFSPELERNPQTTYLNETTLYSHRFTCRVVGWLVEKLTTAPVIKYPMVRFWGDNETLFGSIFTKDDPNILAELLAKIDDENYVLVSLTTGKPIYELYNKDGKLLIADSSIKVFQPFEEMDEENGLPFELENDIELMLEGDKALIAIYKTPFNPAENVPCGYIINTPRTHNMFVNTNQELVFRDGNYRLKIDITQIMDIIANNTNKYNFKKESV